MSSWLQDDASSPGPRGEQTPARAPGLVGPGVVLNGSYRITRKICDTVTSAVFEAANTTSGSRVAIKIILPQLAAIPEMRELLVTEARVLENLNHAAIVTYRGVHDDPALGVTYVVTVFVDGPSLLDVLGDCRPPTDEFRRFALHIASGLAAAHDNGIVHRDVSPDNIMLPNGSRKDGRLEEAKLIDFGISKNLIGVESTVIGEGFTGKFGYAAPEQFNGGETGPWTDIYSFGLVLLALAAGRSSGMGRSRSEAVEKRKSVPDLGAVPEEIRQTVEQMLHPDPQKRLRSMHTVIEQLGGRARPEPVRPIAEPRHEAYVPPMPPMRGAPDTPPETPPPKPGGRRLQGTMWGGLSGIARNSIGYGLAALAGVLVAFVVLVYGLRPAPPSEPTPVAAEAPSLPPAPSPVQPAPSSPMASAGDIHQAAAAAAAGLPCSWLDVADARDGPRTNPHMIALIGVGDSAQAGRGVADALRGVADADLDMRDVWSVVPQDRSQSAQAGICDVLNAFRGRRVARGAAGRPLWVDPLRAHYLADSAPCPKGQRWAKPVVHIDIGDSERHFVLVAINAAGQLQLIGDEAWLARIAPASKGLFVDYGGGRYDLTLCTDSNTPDPASHGLQGIFMVEGASAQDIDLPKTDHLQPVDKSWLALFDRPPGSAWRVQMAWFTVTDNDGGG